MDAQNRIRLARLNSLQIAGLAVLTSTLAALSVLFAVRLAMGRHRPVTADVATAMPESTAPDTVQPAVDSEMEARLPHHFTEDLIIPGFTETGQDVLRDDETAGRSPEGV